jgi:hypothetical protein
VQARWRRAEAGALQVSCTLRRFKVEVQHNAKNKMSQASLHAPPPNKSLERTFHSELFSSGFAFSLPKSPL